MIPALPVRAAGCAERSGKTVTLRASDFDPDVFVWDTKNRAIAYAANVPFVKVEDVLPHIVLAKAGTRAVVVGCNARIVRYHVTDAIGDAVLVRIASGPGRGRLGWVTSSDLR